MPFSLNSVTPGIAVELTECEASPAPFEQLAYLPSPCFWQAFYKHLAPNAEGYPPTAGELCKGLLLSRGVPAQFWEPV